MRERFLPKFVFLFILSSIAFSPKLFSQWELAIDRDSIKVYTKPNMDGYSFYRATGEVNASIEAVYEFMIDVENYPNWVNDCIETKILNKIGNSEYTYFALYDLPWPINNRYSVSNIVISRPSTNEIILESNPGLDYYPEIEDAIAITRFYEKLRIFVNESNRTQVEMEGSYDPAGAIPSWVSDKFMKFGPYDTILEIRKHAED